MKSQRGAVVCGLVQFHTEGHKTEGREVIIMYYAFTDKLLLQREAGSKIFHSMLGVFT